MKGQTPPVIQIIAVRLDGGKGHEHITHLQWQCANSSGLTSAEALITWLRDSGHNQATVQGEQGGVPIEIVTPIGAPSHLRSRAAGQWGEHLLALPRF